ncbi:MAG: DUF2807 domain-containing protein [Flavobacteriales bacterium]|nr:DUF2807 domain-containing protein [Flavobacteriales bacterium]
MNNTDPTFDVLRDLPVEVSLEQVGNMVAGFPLATATSSWLSNFNLNSLLMTTAGTLLVASSIYVFTASAPASASLATSSPIEMVATDDAVVWTPPKEQPTLKVEPTASGGTVQIQEATEPFVAATPEPMEEVQTPEPEAARTTVWVKDESREYAVTGFTSVKILGSMEVVIEQGPFNVQADGNPDLADLFNVQVIGSTLVVSTRQQKGDERERSCNNAAVLTIQMPTLERIEHLGAGSVNAHDFNKVADLELDLKGTGNIQMEAVTGIETLRIKLVGSGDIVSEAVLINGRSEVELTGSGNVRMQGSTEQLDVKVIGSGNVDASDLRSGTCRVNIRGSGDVMVNCQHTTNNSITGTGEVHETGNAGSGRGERTRTY